MRYAEGTDVPVERSRAEIEKTLRRFGASKFQYGWDESNIAITFALRDRIIRFLLRMPDREDPQFTKTPTGRTRKNTDSAVHAWEAAERQRHRALCLSIKAKLVAVEEGIAEFEDEFLANIVVPGGKTVAEMIRPQLSECYESKGAPTLQLTTGRR